MSKVKDMIRSMSQNIGDFFKSTFPHIGELLKTYFNAPGSLMASLTHSGLTREQQLQNEYQTGERVAAEQHQEYLMQHQYQWAVQDAQAAGINPMMIANNGVSTPSTPAPQSAAPGSSGGFGMGDLLSFMLQSQLIPAQKKVLESQAAANNASAAERSAKVPFWEMSTEKALAQIDLIKEQTATEQTKQEFYLARAVLANVNAQNIQYLQESVKNWYDTAAAENEAVATAQLIHALYEKGLIEAGYIDALVEKTCGEAYDAYASGKEHIAGAGLKDRQGNLVDRQAYYQAIVNSLKDGSFTKTFMTEDEDKSFFDKFLIQGKRVVELLLPATSAAAQVATAAAAG